MPKISVIVPVYKVEQFLNKCVQSILSQSFSDFELILVDDGSPDSCHALCDEFAKGDSRVKVIHKSNGGLSDARNAGIEYAINNSDSQYLAFIDSDDYVSQNYLSDLFKACVDNDADVSVGNVKCVNADGSPSQKTSIPVEDCVLTNVDCLQKINGNWVFVVAWGKLYKKSIFINLRFPLKKIHEDEFLCHKIYGNSKTIACTTSAYYYYVQHPKSIMYNPSLKSRLDLIEALIDRFYFFKQHALTFNHTLISANYSEIIFDKLPNCKDKEQKRRFKKIKRLYKPIFFSVPKNRTLPMRLYFYFPKLYKKIIDFKLNKNS